MILKMQSEIWTGGVKGRSVLGKKKGLEAEKSIGPYKNGEKAESKVKKKDKVKLLKTPSLDKQHQHHWRMLEMQFLRPHTGPTELESGTAGGVRDGGWTHDRQTA